MMKHYTLSLLIFAAAILFPTYTSMAITAYPYPVTYTQSDGTRITVRITGDEFRHRVLSEDGYTLTGGIDGDYYYATLSAQGALIPTSVKARPLSQLSKAERVQVGALRKGLEPVGMSPIAASSFRSGAIGGRNRTAAAGIKPPYRLTESVTKGKLRSLIIIVETSDTPFTVASPQQAFSAMLNEPGYSFNGATGSAWNYYNDNSLGQFDPEFVVTRPYRLSQTTKYYAAIDGTSNTPDMVVEACRLADNDVDFSQFANDEGIIRDIFVFYSGGNRAEGVPNTIWPHRWVVYVKPQYESVILDGVKLQGYACSSELSKGQLSNIGIFCHEFGHVLGWPDFYDTNGMVSGDSPGLGVYSLMSNGGYNNDSRTPPASTIIERWMAGWVEPEEINDTDTYLLGSICDNKGYYVGTPTEGDYFLFENRGTNKNVWDNPKYIGGGSGLLVYHVDATEGNRYNWVNNTVNANPTHESAKHVSHPSGIFYPQGGSDKLYSQQNGNYKSWNNQSPHIMFPKISRESNGDIKLIAENLNLTTEANQCDAVIHLKSTLASTYKVEWVNTGMSSDFGQMETSENIVHLTKLTSGATYQVIVTPLSGAFVDIKKRCTLTTQTISENKGTRLKFVKTEYAFGEDVVLSLIDYRGQLQELSWYIDGEQTQKTLLRPAPGEHRIMAVVTDTNGTKEYIVKYITVK